MRPVHAALLALSLLTAVPAAAQTADEIVARNIEAKGGLDRLKAIQTVRQTSKVTMQNAEASVVVYSKRPNLNRQEITLGAGRGRGGGQKVIHSFDGKTAWIINPLTGSTGPIAVSGPAAEGIREQADFDGPLIDHKALGYRLDFIGTEMLDGRRVHHVRLTSRTRTTQDIYIDVETGLESKVVIATGTGTVEQELSDYRDVDGIKVPFSIRIVANGVQQQLFIVERVEFNVRVDDALFRLGR